MARYSQGDIILLSYPFSDQSDSKPRPAIIVSNKVVNGTNDVICAPFTTTIRNDNFSFPIDKSLLNKPLRNNIPGEIRCHKLFLAEKSLIKATISSLKKEKYKELFNKIVNCVCPES